MKAYSLCQIILLFDFLIYQIFANPVVQILVQIKPKKMENTKPSVTILLDTRRKKKEDNYPVKLTVYFDGEKKRYKTGIDLTEDDWKKLNSPNLRDDSLKIIRRKIELRRKNAEEILEKLDGFTFTEFEEIFFGEKKLRKSTRLSAVFDDYIKILEAEDRIGSAECYKTTVSSLIKFRGDIKVNEISTDYLQAYEKYMITNGKSPSTVGIYLRQLRCIINLSIKKGVFPLNRYPYRNYSIPSARNIKKSLSEDQVKTLFNYGAANERLQRALDFWLFSYVSNGMNIADICLLKKKDINGCFFSFHRAKTINTKKKDLRPIKVPLLDFTLKVIEKWGCKNPNSIYLFPILEEKLTAKQIKERIKRFTKWINDGMSEISEDSGLEIKIRTYEARHTHSTILKRKGVSTEVIKENLGHSSVLTTESYLDDFTDDFKMENAKKLLDF